MSRRGNCLDNAPMESFFASLKAERVHEAQFRTRAEARAAVFEYIEVFYNCSSERTSRYVLEENRPCCAGSGTAGCVGRPMSKCPSGNILSRWNPFWFHGGGPIRRSRPMWTNENRARYDRSKLRYPSDLADAEWAIIAPLIPPAKRGGNKRTVVEREIVNGLMYILSTGCQWASLPKDLPPRSTVNDYFCRWNSDGPLDRIHHALYVGCRELAEREASPTAAIIDSQSVKSAEKGGPASIRRATMLARRSTARSAMSWSTRKVCCCAPSCMPPTSRTATEA